MSDEDTGGFAPVTDADTGGFSPVAPMSMADVGMSALKNAPSSAIDFGKSLVQPFIHPIDTATSLKNIGQGALEKAGVLSGEEHKPYADALGKFFADRYGGWEAAKHTMATDPVGFAADLSTVFTGGAGLAARVPGLAGRTAEIAGTVGRAIDPVNAAVAATKPVRSLAKEALGVSTGAGSEAVGTAFQAGREGGTPAKAFQENLRGNAPMTDVVTEARGAVQALRQERGETYRNSMKGLAAYTTPLEFSTIDKALHDAQLVKTYKGQKLSPTTEEINIKLMDEINNWRNLDPVEYHTAEGLDALKQKIGDIRDGTQFGTPERVAANKVYNAVRGSIVKEAPQYAKIMKGYEEASNHIKELESSLSLGQNANVDTALRKLQTVLRNNVNTNYGRRAELADYIASNAPTLMQKLAGQALSSGTPRGFGKLSMQLAAEFALMLAGSHVGGLGGLGMAAATLPAMSPRLVGEGAYYAGKASNYLPPKALARGQFQVGRETELPRQRGGRVDQGARQQRVAAILRKYGVAA